MTCRRLVLSAGTLGTTHLLLRNRSRLPRLSPLLGTRFSGNGDYLTFAHGCRENGGESGGAVPSMQARGILVVDMHVGAMDDHDIPRRKRHF